MIDLAPDPAPTALDSINRYVLQHLAATRQLHHHHRIEGLDHRRVLARGADDDVAGQHGGDRGVRPDGLVGQLRPTCPEDDLRLDVDVELGFEGAWMSTSVRRPKPCLPRAVRTAPTASA